MSPIRPIDRWFIDEVLPHEGAFLKAALRIEKNTEDAHDLVRDAYTRLFSLDGWASIASPRHYTLKMVRNLALERVRRSKVVRFEQFSDIQNLEVTDESPSQHRVVASRDLMHRIVGAINRMPERCRAALVLRRFEEQSAMDAASQLGISVSTLEKRLARSIVLLTEAVSPFSSEFSSDEHCEDPPGLSKIANG